MSINVLLIPSYNRVRPNVPTVFQTPVSMPNGIFHCPDHPLVLTIWRSIVFLTFNAADTDFRNIRETFNTAQTDWGICMKRPQKNLCYGWLACRSGKPDKTCYIGMDVRQMEAVMMERAIQGTRAMLDGTRTTDQQLLLRLALGQTLRHLTWSKMWNPMDTPHAVQIRSRLEGKRDERATELYVKTKWQKMRMKGNVRAPSSSVATVHCEASQTVLGESSGETIRGGNPHDKGRIHFPHAVTRKWENQEVILSVLSRMSGRFDDVRESKGQWRVQGSINTPPVKEA